MNPLLNNLPARWLFAIFAVLAAGTLNSQAQNYRVGDHAANFTLFDHRTGAPVHLRDLEGQIIVIEYFAYWCTLCQAAAPLVERDISQYYQDQNGNPEGLPVAVLAVNVEARDPFLTDLFIDAFGIELVVDDPTHATFTSFRGRGTPHFVIINGVADSSNLDPWEILYQDSGFPGSALLRSIIDAVKGPRATAAQIAPAIVRSPIAQVLALGEVASLTVEATGTQPLAFQWEKDGRALPGAVGAVLNFSVIDFDLSGEYTVRIENGAGSVRSEPVKITVHGPPRLASIQRNGAGAVEFELHGPPGSQSRVETSVDLETWSLLTTATHGGEPIRIQDPDAGGNRQRFYRAVRQQP